MKNRYLLDTHVFLWWMEKNPRLRKNIRDIISDVNSEIHFSTVNVWELVIKKQVRGLKLPRNWKKDLRKIGFTHLPITLEHVYSLETLSLIHGDPFDRLLIAQARAEKLKLVTADPKIWKYKVAIVKA
jgi:PIN domain nuclease of toxin-antitoxin system